LASIARLVGRALGGRIVSGLSLPELSVYSAETCLSLARESPGIYVKMALIELAKSFMRWPNTWSENTWSEKRPTILCAGNDAARRALKSCSAAKTPSK
jgi:hypothetical protein